MCSPTKTFSLGEVLTVVTDRLLTRSVSGEVLEWMTSKGAPSSECKPYLLKLFPELNYAILADNNLVSWLETGQGIEGKLEAIKMWFAELKMMFPEIKDFYDLPVIETENNASRIDTR